MDDPLAVGIREYSVIINVFLAIFASIQLIQPALTKYTPIMLILGAGLYIAYTVFTFYIKQRTIYIITSTFAIIFSLGWLAVKYAGYPLTISYSVLALILLLAGIIFKEVYWRMFSSTLLMVILAKLLLIDSINNGSVKTFLSSFSQ